ncbi:MAG: S1 RNA-binding domain-containing protein [Polyangiaceae bacterium]
MSADRPETSFAALFEQTSKTKLHKRGARLGEAIEVVVVQVSKDAVFVEFEGLRQGLIEAAELRGPDGGMKVAVGDRLRARVVHVDAEQGIRLAPMFEVADAADASVNLGPTNKATSSTMVAVGQVVSGLVDRVEGYGVFLQIEGTKGRAGRGLLPTVELGVARGTDLRKAFPLGTKLTAKVVDMTDGRIRLSLRAMKDDEERAQFEGFLEQEKQATPAPRGFGTIGDLVAGSRMRKP